MVQSTARIDFIPFFSHNAFREWDMDNKTKDEKPAASSNDATKDTTKVEVPKRQQVKPFKKTK